MKLTEEIIQLVDPIYKREFEKASLVEPKFVNPGFYEIKQIHYLSQRILIFNN